MLLITIERFSCHSEVKQSFGFKCHTTSERYTCSVFYCVITVLWFCGFPRLSSWKAANPSITGRHRTGLEWRIHDLSFFWAGMVQSELQRFSNDHPTLVLHVTSLGFICHLASEFCRSQSWTLPHPGRHENSNFTFLNICLISVDAIFFVSGTISCDSIIISFFFLFNIVIY